MGVSELRKALRSSKQRHTRQRQAVYDILITCGGHPTADQVYALARERIPNISLATVYKSLESLSKAGLIGRIGGIGGPVRYDCEAMPHIHLRVLGSGEIHNLPKSIEKQTLASLDAMLSDRIQRELGLQVQAITVEVQVRHEEASSPQVLPLRRESGRTA